MCLCVGLSSLFLLLPFYFLLRLGSKSEIQEFSSFSPFGGCHIINILSLSSTSPFIRTSYYTEPDDYKMYCKALILPNTLRQWSRRLKRLRKCIPGKLLSCPRCFTVCFFRRLMFTLKFRDRAYERHCARLVAMGYKQEKKDATTLTAFLLSTPILLFGSHQFPDGILWILTPRVLSLQQTCRRRRACLHEMSTWLQYLWRKLLTYAKVMMTAFITANPTWGDIFESSKLKARTSLLPRLSKKRRSNFELWALKQHSKMSPQVGSAVL